MEQDLTKRLLALRAKAQSFWYDRKDHLAVLQAHFAKIRPAIEIGSEAKRSSEPTELVESNVPPVARLKLFWDAHRARLIRSLWFPVLFLLGIGVGYSVKSWAENTVTIGHEDYRLVPAEKLYELNTLREAALDNGASLAVETKPVYPSCSEEILSDIETAL